MAGQEQGSTAPVVSVELIKQAVAAEFGLPMRVFISSRRSLEEARPRQIAMALAYQMTANSGSVVGRLFGNRDHSTVYNARRRVDRLRRRNPEFDRRCRSIEAALRPPLRYAEPVQLAFLDGPLFDCLPA